MTGRDESWQDRLDRWGRRAMLPILVLAALLAWLIRHGGYGTATRWHAALIVAAATALWTTTVTMHVTKQTGPVRRSIGFVGHVGLSAALVGLNPGFGAFVFTGYAVAELLPRRWAIAGTAVIAAIISAAEIGGYPSEPSAWPIYLIVLVVNFAVVVAFYFVSVRITEQNEERGAMIDSLHQTNAQLQAALAENAGLHAQLVEQAREAGVQDERQRLAGEIHDTLAQSFVGIVTQLEAADRADDDPAARRRHVRQARELARSGVTAARRSVRALRPEQLDRQDLAEALAASVTDWSARTGVTARFEANGPLCRLPDDVEDALFRIGQEALTNVERHAAARRVGVTLTYLGDVLVLDVRDDGRGWSGKRRPGGFGLLGMRARLDRVGGRLEIETAPGEGTALSASVPVGAVG